MISKSSLRWIAVLVLFSTHTALGLDRSAVDRALSHPHLNRAQVSVEIRSITNGKVVYERNSRTPLIVASNNKLVTTASVLHHLGPEFEWVTGIYAAGGIDGGVLNGGLVLRGSGDPCLSERFHEADPLEPIRQLAAAVSGAGIRSVTGALMLDDTLFDREYVAPGWPQDQLDFYYCAPVSGLAVLENLVSIEVTPSGRSGEGARLRLFPPHAPFRLSGAVEITAQRNVNVVHVGRPDASGVMKVSGRKTKGNATARFSVAVREPCEYFGRLLLAELEQAGVEVAQGTMMVEAAPDYASLNLLGSVRSELHTAVVITNKESQNHYAEQLFKLAGWKVEGKGTFATGEAAAKKMFQDLGLNDADPFTMKDGSGLSRGNTFSARTLTSLLEAIYHAPIRDAYIRSLPIAGVDGSLKKRMTEEPYLSRVRGKTGWIREVSGLSGYAQSLDGEIFAFSILFNKYKGMNAVMKSIQDDICRAIVRN